MTPAFIADRRLCITADRSRVVEAADPDAAFLLVPEGGEVSPADAERYGLTVIDGLVQIVTPATPAPAKAAKAPKPDKGKAEDA